VGSLMPSTSVTPERDEERNARMILSHVVAAGDPRVGHALRQVGAPRVVHQLLNGTSPLPHSKTALARLLEQGTSVHDLVSQDYRSAQRLDARFCIPGDREWPGQLSDLGDRQPLGLWLQGEADLRLLALRSVAMVGARAATSYGESVARTIAGELTSRGWLVVSGGAFGIDAAAHRGALGAGGATVCVLAGGVDVPYPRSHEALLGRIAREGLLISETPLGGAAHRQRFLTRNRLIACLTRATIVVEAALRSGSRTTAREASELVRPVMAIPGPITSPMSAGCHRLIRDRQAVCVTDVEEIEQMLASFTELDDSSHCHTGDDRDQSLRLDPAHQPPNPGLAHLAPRDEQVLNALSKRQPMGLEKLSTVCRLSPTEVLSSLGLLEGLSMVERTEEGWSQAS
jgi:DNA processing protein